MCERSDRMWLLRYHNYHIRRAIRDETGALTPALLTHAIFSIRLYLSERGLRGEREGGRGGWEEMGVKQEALQGHIYH